MASRLFTRATLAPFKIATTQSSSLARELAGRRAFSQTARRFAGEAAVLPARRPVGAFRGG